MLKNKEYFTKLERGFLSVGKSEEAEMIKEVYEDFVKLHTFIDRCLDEHRALGEAVLLVQKQIEALENKGEVNKDG